MRQKKKLTVSILAITLMAIILLIIGALVAYYGFVQDGVRDIYFTEAANSNNEIANSAVALFNEKIEHEIDNIKNIELAHSHSLDTDSLLLEETYYERALENSEYLKRIEILNLDRDIVYSSELTENRVGINVVNYYLFEPLTDIHKLSIGGLIYNSSTNELALEVAYSGDRILVYGLISIDFFRIYGEEFKESFTNKEVMILNDEGKYFYDSFGDQHLIQGYYNDFDELIMQIEETNETTFIINDEISIVSIGAIATNEWRIVIYETSDSALALNLRTDYYYSGILAFIIAIIVIMNTFIIYLIFRDFRQFVVGFEEMSKGNYSPDMGDSHIHEIQILRQGFNSMKNQLKSSTAKLEFLAFHDSLTGLPTSNKAADEFSEFIKKSNFYVLYIDIKRFELLNDNYGYEFGDTILQYVASVLNNYLDKLYRVQSDEFVGILLSKTKTEAINIINEFNILFSKGIDINDVTIPIYLTIGLSNYPNHGDSYDELIKKAIIASHEAKRLENVNVLCYDDAEIDQYARRTSIEVSIQNALINKEFTVVYQPIINTMDHSIRGFEVLSRWSTDELGYIRPDEFIPILERTNQIHKLDNNVVEQAIKFNAEMIKKHNVNFVASVNVSVDTIMQDSFIDMIDNLLTKYNYNPELLEIEITESIFVKDFDDITVKMKYLRNKGIKFSEDDFGDAYSSLTYLTKLEIDTLKVSKNFLDSILDSSDSKILVQTILELAKRLNFKTVVEGIEDEETLSLFKEFGCDYVQGYLFYRPLTADKFEDVIKEKNGRDKK